MIPTYSRVAAIALAATTVTPDRFTHDFVYRPGDTTHDNVFATWAPLIAAVNAVAGVRTILVDTSLGAATVPVGTWPVDGVQFYGKIASTGALPSLTFNDGARLIAGTLDTRNLILISASTVPVMTFTGGDGGAITVTDTAIMGSAAAPFFLVATDSGAVTLSSFGFTELGDGTNAVLQADGAANISVTMFDQTILFANATRGTGALTLSFTPASDTGNDPGDAFVQFPQIAGLIPVNVMPTVPFPTNEQFLANILVPATVVGVDSIQTSNAVTADLPDLALGTTATPMPNHTSGHVELKVVARIPSTGQTVMWHAEAPFKNSGGISVGALANVGGNALSLFGATAGDAAAFAGADIGITVGASGITPHVTGVNLLTIDWDVKVTYFYTHA